MTDAIIAALVDVDREPFDCNGHSCILGLCCHRANQNQPPMGESKPATLRRELHITYSIWFKGKTGLFARLLFWMESTAVIVFLGWFDRAGSVGLFSAAGGDRALQECNPSTHAVRGLRMHPLPASASSGAGSFAFGNASQPRPKAKNSSSFSRRSRC